MPSAKDQLKLTTNQTEQAYPYLFANCWNPLILKIVQF